MRLNLQLLKVRNMSQLENSERVRYQSEKMKVISKEIIELKKTDIINDIIQEQTFQILKNYKNQLVYDFSIDLRGENESIVDVEKFNVNFSQKENIANNVQVSIGGYPSKVGQH